MELLQQMPFVEVAKFTFDVQTTNAGLIMNGVDLLPLVQNRYANSEIDYHNDLEQHIYNPGSLGFQMLRSDGALSIVMNNDYTQVLHDQTNHRFSIDFKQSVINKLDGAEPNSAAVSPLEKTLDVNTGSITLATHETLNNPYWVAANI